MSLWTAFNLTQLTQLNQRIAQLKSGDFQVQVQFFNSFLNNAHYAAIRMNCCHKGLQSFPEEHCFEHHAVSASSPDFHPAVLERKYDSSD